ncbi:hypothetical protein TH61_12285 [Rufibacter sp. DG15C]|uniref:hypothetical protein n=1 Tax=Rufibacter sp. DG15C TaxID=1379909 RepID=UPI00078C4D5F|nr:hypothetical protein [Rufibacter sp. DG15C]AMM51801.1 hypothetical protein TH61_12285 [Rufibacter sp. DG15C]
MKSLVLALVVTLSVASSSLAGTSASVNSAGALARELANTLQLNEMQYLKIKGFETKKLEAIKEAETTMTGEALAKHLILIETSFSASVVEVLTPSQQKAYLGMKSLMATNQVK